MKSFIMLSSVMLMATLLLSCEKDIPVGSQDEVLENETVISIDAPVITNETMSLINDHRIALGLSVLSQHNLISEEASDHTDYMIHKDQANHDYFYEREAYFKEVLNADVVAENVAYAYNSADAVLRAWLGDDERKKNIEGDFDYFGISVKKNSKGRLFYTSIFVKQ